MRTPHVFVEQRPGVYVRFCARCGRREPVPMGRDGMRVEDFTALLRGFEGEHANCPIEWAFSLHRPWGHAILRLGKRIENRSWCFGPDMLGREVAMHSAQKYDAGAVMDLRDDGYDVPPREGLATGFIGIARLRGWVKVDGAGRVVGTSRGVERSAAELAAADYWTAGGAGALWLLQAVRAIPAPIPYDGDQRIWRVEPVMGARLARLASEAEVIHPLGWS